jgi:hypothetical protein
MTAGRQPDPEVDALLPLVYDELRRLAAAYLRRERPGQTLQPTALTSAPSPRIRCARS